jgi:hypothetical protein
VAVDPETDPVPAGEGDGFDELEATGLLQEAMNATAPSSTPARARFDRQPDASVRKLNPQATGVRKGLRAWLMSS